MRRRKAASTDNPGAVALARALVEWQRGISEATGKATIDAYIRSPAGLGWSWEEVYEKNGQFQWCGAFAAFAWGAVKLALRKEHFASTYRLKRWARDTARFLAPRELVAGDVAIVGAANGKKWGDHVVIVEAIEAEQIRTIEGNAVGLAPDGTTWEGVIKTVRPFVASTTKIKRVLFGVRPLAEDFELG